MVVSGSLKLIKHKVDQVLEFFCIVLLLEIGINVKLTGNIFKRTKNTTVLSLLFISDVLFKPVSV